MGKPIAPVKVKQDFKSPISKGWISTFSASYTPESATTSSCASAMPRDVLRGPALELGYRE